MSDVAGLNLKNETRNGRVYRKRNLDRVGKPGAPLPTPLDPWRAMLTVPGGRPWTAATHCGLVLLTAVTPGLRVLLQADTSLQDVSKVIVLPGFI